MDGELKTKLAVLETKLDTLIESMAILAKHVNEELKNHDERVKELELWRAGQAPAWSMLKWIASIIGASFIGGFITCLFIYIQTVI